MTIREFIEANKGNNVRIGFTKGYIFCDYITEDTIKIVDGLSRAYTREAEIKINKLKKDIEELEEGKIEANKYAQLEKRIKNFKIRIDRVRSRHEDGYVEKIKELEKELDEYIVNTTIAIEKSKKSRLRVIKNKKEEINHLRQSIKIFTPYLECEVFEIYNSTYDNSIICISRNNKNIVGKYWDRNDYLNRYKRKKNEKFLEPDTVDSLLRFFASDYGQFLCGNVDPEFIIKEMLDAKLYLVY